MRDLGYEKAPGKAGMSFGSLVVLSYLVIGYVIPGVAIAITGHTSDRYRFPELGMSQVIFGLLIFFILSATVSMFGKSKIRIMTSINPPPFILYAGILLVMTLISAVGFFSGLGRWRYNDTGLSDNFGFISIFYVIAPQIFFFMLFLEVMFFHSENRKDAIQRRTIVLLITIGLAFVASGLGPMFTVLLSFVYFLFPDQIRLFVFKGGRAHYSGIMTRLGVIPMAIFGAGMFLVAVVLGEQVKTGADAATAADHFILADPAEFISYLIDRFSTMWISFRVSLADFTTINWNDTSQNLLAPMKNFLFRIDVLFGNHFGAQRPYVGSLMRANYEMISLDPSNDREGTSPGLIAGFIMSFPIYLAIIFVCAYSLFIVKIVNQLASGMAGTLKFWGVILTLYFVWPLFTSPVDYLLVFDDGLIPLTLFLLLSGVIHRKAAKSVPTEVLEQ